MEEVITLFCFAYRVKGYDLKSYRQNPDKQFSESIIKAARDKGVNYDTRTKLEVLKDLEILLTLILNAIAY